MFARNDTPTAATDAAKYRRTMWVWGVTGGAAVAAWVLVANIRIPSAYQALPMQEVAAAAFLWMFAVAMVAFCALWWTVLRSHGRGETLKALVLILAASLIAGGVALIGETTPRVIEQSNLSLTVSRLRQDNQAILDRYAAGMRAIDPEARLSPFNLGRRGDLADARKGVADATALIDRSRQAYGQTLVAARNELSQGRARPDVLREAQANLEASHATLTAYWSLQGQYGDLLKELLAVIERRRWQVRDAGFVFDNAADRKTYEELLGRLATLSRAIDTDIESRSAAG